MNKGMTVFIIKEICGSWDGCNGYDSDEYWTNWIFAAKEKADDKCKELNEKWGHYGCGSSRKFEVVEDYVIE